MSAGGCTSLSQITYHISLPLEKKVDDPGDSSSTPCNDILEFISSKHYRRISKNIAYLWHQTCMKIVEVYDTKIALSQHGE